MSEVAQEAVVSTPPPVVPAEVEPNDQTAGQAPATETPPAEKAETPDAQPEKQGQSRFERRISKLYRKLGEADARAAALQKELETLKTPKAPEGAPKLEQFDDVEKYAEAREKWAKEQAIKEIEEKERVRARQTEDKTIVESWETQVEAALEKYDDFSDTLSSMQPNTPLTRAIMSAENGAEVAYHLDKNPKALKRILELPPFAQVLAIGKLSAKLESEPTVAKQPSKAPPPIAPVSAKTGAVSDEISPDDDMRTFIRKREKQLGRRK